MGIRQSHTTLLSDKTSMTDYVSKPITPIPKRCCTFYVSCLGDNRNEAIYTATDYVSVCQMDLMGCTLRE